jgi:hypothetical protein
MSVEAFDRVVYENTTRRQWQEAASAWDRWSEVIDRWLGPATEVMLDMAGIGEGSRCWTSPREPAGNGRRRHAAWDRARCAECGGR